MSQLGFGTSSGCPTSSSTPEGVEYIDPTCDTVTAVEDKLRVVGKKAVMHLTVDVWDTIGCDGDNIVRMYNAGNCVYKDGLYYWSLQNSNVDTPPSAKWTVGVTKCEMLEPYRYVDADGVPIPNGACLVTCEDLVNCGGSFASVSKRIDRVLLDTQSADAPSGTAVTSYFEQTINIPASVIAAAGVPACADELQVRIDANTSHNADLGSPVASHLNIDSRVEVDGIGARAYNNLAEGLYGDDHDYDKDSGYVRRNADGSIDIEYRFRGNLPGGAEYATAAGSVFLTGWKMTGF